MRVLLVGASGVVGRQLVPMLIGQDHDVIATSTGSGRARLALQDLGAGVVNLDLLDRSAVRAAVRGAEPDVIVHQATALRGLTNNLRRFDKLFRRTNLLRTQGTAHLLAAAAEAGSPRVIVQSFCGWPWAPIGGLVKSETDPLDADPPRPFRAVLAALREMEAMISGYPGGTALRYGPFYGPHTSLSIGGSQVEAIRRRQFPLVGEAGGIFPSPMSRTQHRPSSPLSIGVMGSTTSSTMIPPRSVTGCRIWQISWARSRLGVCHRGSPESSQETRLSI